MGCAFTFLLSCLVMTVVCYVLGNKYFPVPYHVKLAATYLALAGALIYIAFSFPLENQVLATGFHLLLCLIYITILFLIEKPRLFKPKTVL
jgi:uncharacterized membrane protein YccC